MPSRGRPGQRESGARRDASAMVLLGDLQPRDDPVDRNGYARKGYGVSNRRHVPGLNNAATAAENATNARYNVTSTHATFRRGAPDSTAVPSTTTARYQAVNGEIASRNTVRPACSLVGVSCSGSSTPNPRCRPSNDCCTQPYP